MDGLARNESVERLDNPLIPTLNQFVEDVGLFYERQGMPRIGGRILGLMLISPDPLSAEQIAGLLDVSRSSVSTNLRLLLIHGLIEKVTRRGDRIDYFQFSPTAWERNITDQLRDMLLLRELIEKGLAALPSDSPVRDRLEEVVEFSNGVRRQCEQFLAEWRRRQAPEAEADFEPINY